MAQFTHDGSNESEDVVLMAAIHLTSKKENVWYLDTCCNKHMTNNKNWFVKFDE